LKKISRRESRFRTYTNHCVSKHLVGKAKDTNCAIALEDLSGIGAVLQAANAFYSLAKIAL